MDEGKIIASLNIGTNAVIMLLVRYYRDGTYEIVNEFGGVTGLLENMTEDKYLKREAIKYTINLCREVVDIANAEGAEKIIATVTSSIRKAVNKTEFLVGCHNNFDIFPHVLTNNEEAHYVFKGITDSLEVSEDRPLLVIEIGGDTIDIICGTKGVLVEYFNLNIGVCNLLDIYDLRNKPFSKLKPRLSKHIKKQAEPNIEKIKTWLNGRTPRVLGTGNILVKYTSFLIKKESFNRKNIDNFRSSTKNVKKFSAKLGKMSKEKREEYLGREDDGEKLFIGIYAFSILLNLIGINEFSITSSGLRTGILSSFINKVQNYK